MFEKKRMRYLIFLLSLRLFVMPQADFCQVVTNTNQQMVQIANWWFEVRDQTFLDLFVPLVWNRRTEFELPFAVWELEGDSSENTHNNKEPFNNWFLDGAKAGQTNSHIS